MQKDFHLTVMYLLYRSPGRVAIIMPKINRRRNAAGFNDDVILTSCVHFALPFGLALIGVASPTSQTPRHQHVKSMERLSLQQ